VKIILVYPRFEKFLKNNPDLDAGLIDYFLGDFTTPPSLGIPILASITPPEHEVILVDDNSGDIIDFDIDADLIGINCFTPQATRAFEIADGYRAHGKKVIMGGFFPSFMVDECLKHADSVNVGECEPTWHKILEDVQAGQLKKVYKGGCSFDVSKMKIPKREIFYNKTSYDWDEDLVQVTRGCMYNCAMCAIPAHMGSRMRFRPIEHVVNEVAQLKYENVYLADDTLFFPQKKMVEYSRALLEALTPLNKKYFVASTMALNTDSDFLDLMARAGVKNFYCTMNVDPVSIKALAGGKAEIQALVDLVKKLEDRDIRFFGSCGLGRDWDDTSIADKILELYNKAGIHTAEFFVFTPYPGSVHWDRLIRQNRIIDFNWSHYNGAHVVTQPTNMSPDELYGQFIKVWNEFFRMQKHAHAASLEPATWKDGKKSVGKPLERQGVKGQAVVTGLGLYSPIGNSPDAVTDALKNGQKGIAPVTRFDASHFRTNLCGEIRNFDPLENMTKEEVSIYDDLYLQYAISSARKAVKDAKISLSPENVRNDVAIVLGTCNGGLLSAEEEYKWLQKKSDKPFTEKMNLMAQYYGFGKAMAHALGVSGEIWVVTTACSSTTGALGLSQLLINRGYYKTVLVIGADSLCIANMSGFNGLKAVSTAQTAPFSNPPGLNIGEASVCWVVEEMEAALLRHARCYGKLAGHATTCDAYHPTSPDPRGEGVTRTLKNALQDSGLPISDIGCINAHATGTEANDRAETKGICKFLENNSIPVTATKSFFGHCMGTTGLLEATCNLLAMNAGFIPPTINFTDPRPGCTLDYVSNKARECEYDAFMSANYAFGGNNAAVVVTSWEHPIPARKQPSERVVITGAGVVSSLGLTTEKNIEALNDNVCGIKSAERLGHTGLRSKKAGLAPYFKASDIDRKLDFTGMNLISKMAVAAANDALNRAELKIRSKNSEDVGIAMGVCNGPPESDHMNKVFSTPDNAPDINNFSNITANSTAGWVAGALALKGVNMTLAPGHHAGLQALAYAYEMLLDNRAKAVLASASDEIYAQTFYNYDLIEYLYNGNDEDNYRLRFDTEKRKVLGEGAASLVLETASAAKERSAEILGEVCGYGMSMDLAAFDTQCMSSLGLENAIKLSLERANTNINDIDCIVWAPQGNKQDQKMLLALENSMGNKFKEIPFITTTFNTGYIESASVLASLGLVLESIRMGKALWSQRTGNTDLDNRTLDKAPEYLLVIGSSDLGYNYSVVVKVGERVTDAA
jgi:3-oxoacyl-[acyl-carrier-protein] synthase II